MGLDKNPLSGTIPSEFGLLTSLAYLFLGQNNVTGPIPSVLGTLSSLVAVHLDATSLTGTIPVQIGDLSSYSLSDFNIEQSTGLFGTAPSQLCELNKPCFYLPFDKQESEQCSFAFDCSDTLCGCDCLCNDS